VRRWKKITAVWLLLPLLAGAVLRSAEPVPQPRAAGERVPLRTPGKPDSGAALPAAAASALELSAADARPATAGADSQDPTRHRRASARAASRAHAAAARHATYSHALRASHAYVPISFSRPPPSSN
jgi:hypothetical protein